jgi:hypothetical protein
MSRGVGEEKRVEELKSLVGKKRKNEKSRELAGGSAGEEKRREEEEQRLGRLALDLVKRKIGYSHHPKSIWK